MEKKEKSLKISSFLHKSEVKEYEDCLKEVEFTKYKIDETIFFLKLIYQI